MTERIAPVQTTDRQINTFAQQTRAECSRLDTEIAARALMGSWADMPPDGQGRWGDTYAVDEIDGGGSWQRDKLLTWRPLAAGVPCVAPPPVAQWTRFNATAANNFLDRYGEIHMSAAPAEGRSGGFVAFDPAIAAKSKWRITAGFKGICGNDQVADENAGFGVFVATAAGVFAAGECNVMSSTTNTYARFLGGYGNTLSGSYTFSGGSTERTAKVFGPGLYLRLELINGNLIVRGGPDKSCRFSSGFSVAYGTAFAATPTLCGIYVFSNTTSLSNWAENFHLEQEAA